MKREIVVSTDRNDHDGFTVIDDDVDFQVFLKDFLEFFNTVPMVFDTNKDKSTATETVLTLNVKMKLAKSVNAGELDMCQRLGVLKTFYSRQHTHLFKLFDLRFYSTLMRTPFIAGEIVIIREDGCHFGLTPKTSYRVSEKLLSKHFTIMDEHEGYYKVNYKQLYDISEFFWDLRKDISDSNTKTRNDPLGCMIPAEVIDALVDLPDTKFNIDTNTIYTTNRDIRKALKPGKEQMRVCFFDENSNIPTTCMFIYRPALLILNKALAEAMPDYKLEYISENGVMQDINITLPGNSNYLKLKRFEKVYLDLLRE